MPNQEKPYRKPRNRPKADDIGGPVASSPSDLMKRQQRFATKSNDSYGYVSRGEDSRLQSSHSKRKAYFDSIMAQFVQYCSENTSNDVYDAIIKEASSTEVESEPPQTLPQILTSLRKLREALLHIPPDSFSKKVHLVSVRISANIGHYQTYLPCIRYLLEDCKDLITRGERIEMATLFVLHLLHFNDDSSGAIRYYSEYLESESVTKDVIKCWIHRDYHRWIELYNKEVDNSRSKIMSLGIRTMLGHMVACIRSSYFNLTIGSILLPKGIKYEYLEEKFGVDWKLNGDTLVIRERKKSG